MAFETKAIVARDILTNDGWKLEDVTVRKPGSGELLVEMVASGICHSDIVVGMSPKGSHYAQYPRVLGHEGSGYVKEVGPGVTIAKPGDPVLCSFAFCESCHQCKAGITARCNSFSVLNTHSPEQTFTSSGKSEPDIAGVFFGQSSFANLSIVKQTSIVNASSLSLSKKELQMLAPLGCGVQTGTGSITNVANAQPDDVACIVGLGGVGLSALMGAKLRGCRTIIGIDRVPSRLELAKECGATHVINTSDIPEDSSLKAVLQEIADEEGPSITVETTGVPALAETAFDATRKGGKYIQVAIFSDMSYDIKFSLARGNLFANKWFIGAVEGWAHPPSFIPQMIQWWKEGKFPVDKMVKTMKAEEFQKALEGMHDGSIIKPVILWS